MTDEAVQLRTWEITCEADTGRVVRDTYIVQCIGDRAATRYVLDRFRKDNSISQGVPVIARVVTW